MDNVQGLISGLLCLIDVENIPSVLDYGLSPAHQGDNRYQQEVFGAVHLFPFSPFEERKESNRGELLEVQLQHAKNSAKHIAQVSLNIHGVWPMLRPCLLDGRLLHFGPIHALHIESITEHYWDAEKETWVGSFVRSN